MVEIKFNSKIYKIKAIKKAFNDYKDLAKFELKNNKNNTIVRITKIDPEHKDILKDEFCNYVLYQLKC